MVRAKLPGSVACGAFYLVLLGCGGDVTRQPSAQRDVGGDATAAVSTFDAGALQDATETLPDVSSAMDAGSLDAGSAMEAGSPDANPCMVVASDYDQTCSADSDCVGVISGDVCPLTSHCGVSTFLEGINVSQQDVYESALETALAKFTLMEPLCPQTPIACCRGGLCAGTFECVSGDAGTTQPISDASFMPNYTVLCVEDAGAMDSGSAVPGESRWCNGPEQCLQFNGGWQCCVTNFGPVAMCVAP
jgi:hypothetical protein